MGVNKRFLYWGTFFISMGVIALAAESRLVDDALVGQAWRLWPLALVGFGIGLILRRTRLDVAGGMLVAAVPGLALGGLIAVGPQVTVGCSGSGQPAQMVTRQGSFSGPAQVDLTLHCGEVSITTGSGSGWQLETGNTDNVGAVVTTSASHLGVSSGRPQGAVFNARDVWRLSLPTATPMALTVQVDAGKGTLDLAGAQLQQLAVTTNAGDLHANLSGATAGGLSITVNAGATTLQLPDGSNYGGTLSVNAGSLKICAPPDLGLRINSSASLGSAHYPGLVQSGSVWESPGYATAAHRADLTANVNLGSIELNPTGGCQ